MGLREHQQKTTAAYDADAAGWAARREPGQLESARSLRRRLDGLIVDLGCGPGWHLPLLAPSIGIDLSHQMLVMAKDHGPVAHADLSALPLRRESVAGVWASRSLVHLHRSEVPMALAELHRVVKTDGEAFLWVFEGDAEGAESDRDSFPGRTFSFWEPEAFRDVVVGSGFEVAAFERWPGHNDDPQITVTARRTWTLPDYVSANMKLLICGLNPSPSSADSGVGFFRAGNRFWPAALKAGLVSKDRDPQHALLEHGVGMTDLVKRPTRRADELDRSEYQDGLARLERTVERLQPRAICMVGLAGWRAVADRKAERGWQPDLLGGRPVYLMPSTSGLNAHDTIDSLAHHLATAHAAVITV